MNESARAAELTVECVRRIAGWSHCSPPEVVRDVAEGRTSEHAMWMLEEIISGRVTGNKAQRWLGYAQGLLVAHGRAILAEMKSANRRASEEEHEVEIVEWCENRPEPEGFTVTRRGIGDLPPWAEKGYAELMGPFTSSPTGRI
jgi:hypothetical protein